MAFYNPRKYKKAQATRPVSALNSLKNKTDTADYKITPQEPAIHTVVSQLAQDTTNLPPPALSDLSNIIKPTAPIEAVKQGQKKARKSGKLSLTKTNHSNDVNLSDPEISQATSLKESSTAEIKESNLKRSIEELGNILFIFF
jgi:hypothetical protein